jgi:hypothetical protein
MERSGEVTLSLTEDEALVLFEFLARINEAERPGLFEDQAEQRALWNLAAALEKKLIAPLRPDYSELLQRARARLRDEQ